MKCKCGGIMQLKRLCIDTEARVCMLCGRDDIERKSGLPDPEEIKSALPVNKWKLPRTCPSCGRENLIFTGKCQRCVWRIKHDLDLMTGQPLKRKAA